MLGVLITQMVIKRLEETLGSDGYVYGIDCGGLMDMRLPQKKKKKE